MLKMLRDDNFDAMLVPKQAAGKISQIRCFHLVNLAEGVSMDKRLQARQSRGLRNNERVDSGDAWPGRLSSERMAPHIQTARNRVCDGPAVLHGFGARRRPVLSTAGGFVWMILCAAVWAVALGVAKVDTEGLVRITLWLLPLILFSQTAAWGVGHALGFGADGSVTVALYSTASWHRRPCRGIVHIASLDQLIVEPSAPWWRTRRVVVADNVWHLANQTDTELFDRMIEQRQASLSTSMTS